MYNTLDANLLRIPGSIQELAPLAKAQGFQGICLRTELLENPAQGMEAAKLLQDLDMHWGLLPTPEDFFQEELSDEAFAAGLETLKRWAEVGEKLGVRYSYNHVWPSSAKRAFEENFDWHVQRLEKIQAVLKDHGIGYGFEFLGPHELRVAQKHPFVHTIAGVLSIADAAGGYTGFLFDVYHWYCGSGRLDDLYFAAQNVGRMVNLHLSDGQKGLARDEQRDLHREMPMTTGVIDARMIYQTFLHSGYKGPAMCEPMMPSTGRFAQMAPAEAIAEVAAAFARLQ